MNKRWIRILSTLPVQVLCSLILGGVFIYASIDKISHPQAFAKIISNYQLLPAVLVTLPAMVLPWLELISGVLLAAGIFRRAAAGILSSLLVVFAIAISINLARGIKFDCGCFSTVTTVSGSDPVGLLIRDILLLIPGLIIILFPRDKKESQTSPSEAVNPA